MKKMQRIVKKKRKMKTKPELNLNFLPLASEKKGRKMRLYGGKGDGSLLKRVCVHLKMENANAGFVRAQ